MRILLHIWNVLFLYIIVSGCSLLSDSQKSDKSEKDKYFIYNVVSDSFAGTSISTASGSFKAVPYEAVFIEIVVQCLNYVKDNSKNSLEIFVRTRSNFDVPIGIVLYKIDDQDAALYEISDLAEASSDDSRIIMNAWDILGSQKQSPKNLTLRISHGRLPEIYEPTVQNYSRLDATDILIPLNKGNTGKVISDCT